MTDPAPSQSPSDERDTVLTLARAYDRRRDRVGDVVGIHPDVLTQHVLISGTTGTGKSVAACSFLADTAETTDGATILIDPKGDGLPEELCRTLYARRTTGTPDAGTDSLSDVLFFDCSDVFPRVSFFDVRGRPADVSRRQEVDDIIERYIDVARRAKPTEKMAERSPEVLRRILRALFDEAGRDAFTHDQFMEALWAFSRDRSLPDVESRRVQRLLESLQHGDERMAQRVIDGAVTRAEAIHGRADLRALFNHAPADPSDRIDFEALLSEDVTIIFDLGALTADLRQQALAQLLVKEIWAATRRRARRAADPDSLPTALLAIDEAVSLDVGELLSDVLSQARGYQLGALVVTQYPDQFGIDDSRARDELLNEVSTILTGELPHPGAMAERLATHDTPPAETKALLRRMPDDKFMFSPATPRGAPTPAPATVHQPPLPAGHPDGPAPLSDAAQDRFAAALAERRDVTEAEYGGRYPESVGGDSKLPVTSPDRDVATPHPSLYAAPVLSAAAELLDGLALDHDATVIRCRVCESAHEWSVEGLRAAAACCHDVDPDPDTDPGAVPSVTRRTASPTGDTALRSTQRAARRDDTALPDRVTYDPVTDTYQCQRCAERPARRALRYPPTTDGLRRALTCHGDLFDEASRDALRTTPTPGLPLSRVELDAFPHHADPDTIGATIPDTPADADTDATTDDDTAPNADPRTAPGTPTSTHRAGAAAHTDTDADADADTDAADKSVLPIDPTYDLSVPEARFLVLVELARRQRLDETLEFSLVHDSMRAIREDCGLTNEVTAQLSDGGLLSITETPRLMYSLTRAARRLLFIPQKHGEEFGVDIGDLNETALHAAAVEAEKRRRERALPDQPGLSVRTYYPLDDLEADRSADVAVTGPDGDILAVTEVERDNNDNADESGALRRTYNKLAALDIADSPLDDKKRWVVENQPFAPTITQKLAADDDAAYSGTAYADNVRIQNMSFTDQDGITDMTTIKTVLDDVTPPWPT